MYRLNFRLNHHEQVWSSQVQDQNWFGLVNSMYLFAKILKYLLANIIIATAPLESDCEVSTRDCQLNGGGVT